MAAPIHGAETLWTFSDPVAPFIADAGTGTMTYYDPFSSGWGDVNTAFGPASSFGLPSMNGEDPAVMSFPACASDQGYLVSHNFLPNGTYADDGYVSNYTIVMDVLFPASSDGLWRALVQTDPNNFNDGEFFVQNQLSGGIGINGNYRGEIKPDTWHRIVWVVRAAPGEGQAHRYIDGQFVGAIGTTGSGLDLRWALNSQLLLLTDDNNETAPGYLSSISIIDRKLSYDEVVALGRPDARGANTAGPAAATDLEKMSRPVKTLGHRGASGCAPENTLAAVLQAFDDGAAGTEIDTRITSDGVVIAFHDSTLDRTTNGTGPVLDQTLAQIKQLDAGSWFSPDFVGEKVPTLAEVLTAVKGKGIIYLDIKTGGQTQGFVDALNESGFPLEDLWFWTPGNAAYAAEIRAAIPGAQIVWGNPAAAWQSDPNYFSDLQDLGVIGFSFGQGSANLEFSYAAKAAGMFVEIYTILDPVQMRDGANLGVDFMETDFPNVMEDLQPIRLAPASGPQPPSGSSDFPLDPQILAWIPGANATAHRIHFGTTDPPAFVAEQSFDLFKTPKLDAGTTYFWRVDSVTPSGIETGPVWSLTTRAALPEATIHEWHFNDGLNRVTGDAFLAFASFTEDEIAFETSDGTIVPNLEGNPVQYLRVPAFVDSSLGVDLSFTTTTPNGGGDFINQYSFVFDVLIPGPIGWTAFFNTNAANTNDGDFFARAGGGLGIGATGYAPDGSVLEGTWHRIIYSANLTDGVVTYYVDGVPVNRRTGGSLLDGRFSLNSSTTGGPHVRLFNDNDGETTEFLVSAIAFLDGPIGDDTAAELGGVAPSGIFITTPKTITLNANFNATQNQYLLTWNTQDDESYLVETSTDLIGWDPATSDIRGNNGQATLQLSANSYPAEPARFFRVVRQ